MSIMTRMNAALYPPIGAVPNTVQDYAGNNDGTNFGATVAVVDGRAGLEFDGVDDYIAVGEEPSNIPRAEVGKKILIEARIIPNNIRDAAIISYTENWEIRIEDNGEIWFRIFGDNNGGTTNLVGAGVDQHIAVFWKVGEAIDTFFNGDLVDTHSTSFNNDQPNKELFIGRSFSGGTNNHDGFMYEARIWDLTGLGLTDQQVYDQVSANHSIRLTGNETGLVGYWPMAYSAHL